jgi:hypothetical protein
MARSIEHGDDFEFETYYDKHVNRDRIKDILLQEIRVNLDGLLDQLEDSEYLNDLINDDISEDYNNRGR